MKINKKQVVAVAIALNAAIGPERYLTSNEIADAYAAAVQDMREEFYEV